MVSEEQQRLGRSLPIHLLLALDAVKQLHRASVQDVAERIHTDESRVRVALETLVESGLVERLGNGRGRYYIMSSRYSKKRTMPSNMCEIEISMRFGIRNW